MVTACSSEGETTAPYIGKRGTHSFDAKEVSRGVDPDCLGVRAAGPRQACTARRGPASRARVRVAWPARLGGVCAADASARRARRAPGRPWYGGVAAHS
jgi:hypothetical protein